MPSAQDLGWYASHSVVTSPAGFSSLLRDLPASVAGLRQVAHGLVIHYRDDEPLDAGVPHERLAEIDSRYAERMLGRLAELQAGSLLDARGPTQRLVGCGRDFTVLFLAMAREWRIPARGRIGFARYFVANLGLDHEVAEVWDREEERWRLIDAELAEDHVDPTDGRRIDPLDVPRDRFLVAGKAWQLCRAGEADPETFMVDPGLDVECTRSWPYLQHNLIHDLAALNKLEMLLWDAWGLAVSPEKVGPLVDASDGWLVAKGRVSSSMVVVPEPSVKGCVAFGAGAVDRTVGPAAQEGADESFGFAVGLGPVGAGAQVAYAERATGDRMQG